MEFEFKKLNKSVESRKSQCIKIKNQFTDKVPVICERDPKSNLPDLDKHKYIVPNDLTVEQFILMIKRRMDMGPFPIDQLYLIVNEKDFISGDILMSEIYNKYKNYQDDLLYIRYSDNNKWL